MAISVPRRKFLIHTETQHGTYLLSVYTDSQDIFIRENKEHAK